MDDASDSWVELNDPQTRRPFFANTETGECLWELPEGAKLADKDTTGDEWWELFDDSHQLPYYYNTRTTETEWIRPESGKIIPLTAIRRSEIGKRVSADFFSTSTLSRDLSELFLASQSADAMDSVDRQIEHEPRTSSRTDVQQPQKQQQQPISKTMISEPVQDFESAAKMRRDLVSPTGVPPPVSQVGFVREVLSNDIFSQSMPTTRHRSKRDSKKLPDGLLEDISKFQILGFAKQYFAEHRRGLFRRQVPVEVMLKYQSSALKTPLMVISPTLKKDACKCFKLTQKIMTPKADKTSNIANIQVLIEKGIRHGGLRDEIFLQICKQLSENPSKESTKRGWRLFSVISSVIPPSKNLENYLKHFVNQQFNHKDPDIETMARFSMKMIEKLCKTGPKGRTLSVPEIERAWDAPFLTSVFGETLETIMEDQKEKCPDEVLPKILVFLVDSILKLKGYKTEGIFRISGQIDEVSDLRCRIEQNRFDLSGIKDPNVPSSLLKLWLRELAEPLIPDRLYQTCLSIGKDEECTREQSLRRSIAVIESLPEIHRNVIYYLINFLREIAKPENTARTKMNVANIAMVFAPNFLRCPSDDPLFILQNTKFEQKFLSTLITGTEY